jgi:hypothetical protein
MHEVSKETSDIVDVVLEYSRRRILSSDTPLDKPLSAAELDRLAGRSIDEKGIGATRALALFEHVLAPACITTDHPQYLSFIPSAPTKAAIFAESADEVSGPVAMITGRRGPEAGISATSPRSTRIRGCAAIASVIRSAKPSRSTARAAPAGTRTSSATRMTSDPSRRISSFRSPTALSSLSPRNELLQTSSASRSVL